MSAGLERLGPCLCPLAGLLFLHCGIDNGNAGIKDMAQRRSENGNSTCVHYGHWPAKKMGRMLITCKGAQARFSACAFYGKQSLQPTAIHRYCMVDLGTIKGRGLSDPWKTQGDSLTTI